ncbi:MAG: BON domain-containing protein [Nitrososphaeraceae archaeon]
MSCIHITLIVAEKEKGNRPEPRKQPSEDYYSGYYWGNEPYDSSDIVDRRKTDDELKNKVNENLRKNERFDLSHIEAYVKNSAVTLKGSVKTYEERGLAGQAAWNVSGVSEVFNDLQVTEPETVGPRPKL